MKFFKIAEFQNTLSSVPLYPKRAYALFSDFNDCKMAIFR